MSPRLKICCIQDAEEAALAVAAGAHALGFVGRGLSGPEVIDEILDNVTTRPIMARGVTVCRSVVEVMVQMIGPKPNRKYASSPEIYNSIFFPRRWFLHANGDWLASY